MKAAGIRREGEEWRIRARGAGRIVLISALALLEIALIVETIVVFPEASTALRIAQICVAVCLGVVCALLLISFLTFEIRVTDREVIAPSSNDTFHRKSRMTRAAFEGVRTLAWLPKSRGGDGRNYIALRGEGVPERRIDVTLLSPEQVAALMQELQARIGLCNGRPVALDLGEKARR